MVKAKEYSCDFKDAVVRAVSDGKSKMEVALDFQISKQLVGQWVKKKQLVGTTANKPRSGRPKGTTRTQDVMIIRESMKDPKLTAVDILSNLSERVGLKCATSTVQRRLRSAGLHGRRPSKKPLISEKNRKARLKFALEHEKWKPEDWEKVLWSDESKFNFVSSDGIKYVRRPTNKRNDVKYQVPTVKHGGGNVMVWGCFSRDGVGPLHQVEGIMDGPKYVEIIKDVMLPHATKQMHKKWIFQQDNDPKHTSKVAKNFFRSKKIRILEWPSQSPDLNPIEHLWDVLDRSVRKQKNTNKANFFANLKQCWEKIGLETLIKLVDSMPRRCKAVIYAKGYPTKY